jgi:hypothetical protein
MNEDYTQELKQKIIKIEEEIDSLSKKERRFIEMEEDENWRINSRILKMEDEVINYGSDDNQLYLLLDERRNLFSCVKQENASFREESRKWYSDRKRELDSQMESIIREIRLKEKEEI